MLPNPGHNCQKNNGDWMMKPVPIGLRPVQN